VSDVVEISADRARRIALGALGFAQPRPARATAAHVRRTAERLGVVQIDSVNVLVRAQYQPLFSRIGAYDRPALDALVFRKRKFFEYWGHEASFLPVETFPLFRWRMERSRRGETWGNVRKFGAAEKRYVADVLARVRGEGPLGASAFSADGLRSEPWWGWAPGKLALEWLFWCGEVLIANRRNFERLYDIPERVIPAEVLAMPSPPEAEARKRLLVRASRALGVGTARDLADYYRINVPDARALVRELAEEGIVREARVEGWREHAYLDPAAVAPRKVEARALVSPFDPLVWERARTERMFGFRYRIEIYVPPGKRVHGYYVLPFLLGERLVARVDLKADRARAALLVQAAYAEPGAPRETAGELAAELREWAAWLGLERVEVAGAGDLAAGLKRALGRRS
jgi:uncharacterized protein YcaQ